MGQATIAGTFSGGPVQVGTGMFPQAAFITQLVTTPNPKPFSAASGVLQRRVATVAPAFVTLSGVGPTDTVVRGDLLFMRTDSPLQIRISQTDPLAPSGPALTATLNIQGLVVLEFSPSSQLVLLEACGAATIEYSIVGQ